MCLDGVLMRFLSKRSGNQAGGMRTPDKTRMAFEVMDTLFVTSVR
jgi:hypothetical protein